MLSLYDQTSLLPSLEQNIKTGDPQSAEGVSTMQYATVFIPNMIVLDINT